MSAADGLQRAQFVRGEANFFLSGMCDELGGTKGLNAIETFANGIEGPLREASRTYSDFLQKKFSNNARAKELALTSHADHARSIASSMIKLKGFVAALKVNPNNQADRIEAIRLMGYLRAQRLAMESCIY